MKAHSEKFMNVSDMQVPDEDERMIVMMGSLAAIVMICKSGHTLGNLQNPWYVQRVLVSGLTATVKANNEILKERNWINPVTSKIEFQPWEPDTDAQLHEESVISVRIQAEICISSSAREKCPKWSADTQQTLRRDEISGRDQVCAENCWDSTSAKISTDDPDDDSQQGPEHTDARPRADSRSVVRCSDADLEQTAQSPGTMLQISSRQQTSFRERKW